MATQNIAIPTGESASVLAMLATHIFENHGKEMGDAIINKNYVLAYLKSKCESLEVGGLDFSEPVLTSANSNFGFRNKRTEIPSDAQNHTQEFKFDPIVLDGTVVINKVDELMNRGKHQIMKLATTLKKQAESTVANLINTQLWDATPTANVEPESIPSLVSATPTTGTIGGQSRVTNLFARNKVFTTTISSVGSAAGMASLHRFRASLGGAAATTPDFAVTTATIWGLIMGFLDNNRRIKADEKMSNLGFDNIYIGSALLGYDGDAGAAVGGDTTLAGCPANQLYYLNSKHLFYKILEGGNTVFEPFSKKDNSLNETSIFYHVYQLTTNQPNALGVATAITG